MSIYKSENVCTIDDLGYEGLFSHDRGTETLIIKDEFINDATIAQERATSELIKNGFKTRVVNITSVHINNLKQNDIITFQGLNWIVKEIGLTFTPPKLIQKIKGVRYE
jgi:hypothetical protein